MKKALPFLVLGDAAVEELERKVNDSLSQLYPDWLSESDQINFTITGCNKSLVIEDEGWDVYGSSDASWVAFKKDEKVKNTVLKKLFELDQHANFNSTKLTDTIYQDFINSNVNTIFKIGNFANVIAQDKVVAKSAFGSGAVIGTILHGSVNIPIAIGGALVMDICSEFKQKLQKPKTQRQLTQRERLLAKLESELEVSAGKVQISFADFSNMEVGDVVLLDTKVGAPFNANLSDDVQSNVQLCRLGNQKAIQFIE